jgi:hypothetical protein
MKSFDFALNEIIKLKDTIETLLDHFTTLKEIHSKSYSSLEQKIQTFNKKTKKNSMIMTEILRREKQESEVKASFLSLNSISPLENLLKKIEKSINFLSKICKKFTDQNKLFTEKIKKLSKQNDLISKLKIKEANEKMKQFYRESEDYFKKADECLLYGIDEISDIFKKYLTFNFQHENSSEMISFSESKLFSEIKLFSELGEMKNVLEVSKSEESIQDQESISEWNYREAVEFKTFFGDWKNGFVFVFPENLIFSTEEQIDPNNLISFDLKNIKLVSESKHQSIEKKIILCKKNKNIFEKIFGIDQIKMKFKSDGEAFKKAIEK